MALRELLAIFDIKVDASQLQAANGRVDGFKQKLISAGSLLAGGLVTRGLYNFAQGLVATGDHLSDTAKQLGVSTQALQQWGIVAKYAGATLEDVQAAFRVVNRQAYESARSVKGPAADAFRALGVSVKDASGEFKSTDQIFSETLDGLAAMTNQTERTGIAQTLFGRGAVKLANITTDGAAGVAKLKAKISELGGAYSKKFVQVAEEAEEANKDFEVTMRSLKSTIGEHIIPVLTVFLRWLVKGTTAVLKWARGTNIIKSVMIVFTGGALIGLIRGLGVLRLLTIQTVLPFLAFAAVIAIAILVVDDLITLFQGGHSAIGDLIDGIWGVGTAAEIVETVKDWFSDLIVVIKEIPGFFESMVEGLSNWLLLFDPVIKKIEYLVGLLAQASKLVASSSTFSVPGFLADKASKIANTIGIGTGSAPSSITAAQSAVGPRVSTGVAGVSSTVINSAPVINVSGAQDPKAVAREVAAKLSKDRAAQYRRVIGTTPLPAAK